MSTVQVETPGGSYPIHVAAGRLAELAQSIPSDAKAIAIVTNPTVASYYAERVEQALVQKGKRELRIELPDGEAHNNWQTLNLTLDTLLQNNLDCKEILLALGGGVMGVIWVSCTGRPLSGIVALHYT